MKSQGITLHSFRQRPQFQPSPLYAHNSLNTSSHKHSFTPTFLSLPLLQPFPAIRLLLSLILKLFLLQPRQLTQHPTGPYLFTDQSSLFQSFLTWLVTSEGKDCITTTSYSPPKQQVVFSSSTKGHIGALSTSTRYWQLKHHFHVNFAEPPHIQLQHARSSPLFNLNPPPHSKIQFSTCLLALPLQSSPSQ